MRSIACNLLVAGLPGIDGVGAGPACEADRPRRTARPHPAATPPRGDRSESPEPTAPPKRVTVTFGVDSRCRRTCSAGSTRRKAASSFRRTWTLASPLYQGTGSAVGDDRERRQLEQPPLGAERQQRRGNAWYEADYYGSVTFTSGKWKPGALLRPTPARTMRSTGHELAGVLAYDDSGNRFPLSPKAILAFELDGQADGGAKKARTSSSASGRRSSRATRSVTRRRCRSVKFGLSLHDYYEGPTGEQQFGYFDTGAIVSVPLAFMPARADLGGARRRRPLWLGDNLEVLNGDDGSKPVGSIGFSVTY